MRGSNIGLLNYLLGFQQQNAPWNPQQQLPASQGGPMRRGGQSTEGRPGMGAWTGMPSAQMGGMPTGGGTPGVGTAVPFNGMSPMTPQGGGGFGQPMPGGFNPVNSQAGPGTTYLGQPGSAGNPWMNSQMGQASNPMLSRIESYFGPLGTPTTPLQQQSLGGISQYLNSNPFGQSNSALNQVLGGQGYDEANQAFRSVGGANYFGGAQNAFNNLGNQNLFGGAENAFRDVGNENYFGNAEGVFNRLEGFNPFGAAQGSMEGILGTNPGLQGMDALRPLLDRNLAAANQQGGRFGSANAILRSRAVDDNNLLAAQMYQRGVDQQISAAGQYGMMGNSLIGARGAAGQGLLGVGQGRLQQGLGSAQGLLGAGQGRLQQGLGVGQGLLGVGQGQLSQGLGSAQGLGGLAQALQGDRLNAAGQLASNQNSMFNNLQGGYNTGTMQANQEAQRQQQALNILLGQLGVSQQASFGGPTVVQPSGAQQGAQMGGDIGALIAMMMNQQRGG